MSEELKNHMLGAIQTFCVWKSLQEKTEPKEQLAYCAKLTIECLKEFPQLTA